MKLVDLETGCSRTLLDLNPDGWVQVSVVEVWRCGEGEASCSRMLLNLNPDGWVQVGLEVWKFGGMGAGG